MNFTNDLTNAIKSNHYRKLQKVLKAYRAAGNEVRVKLNVKKYLLMEEAQRILFSIRQQPIEINWVTFFHTISKSSSPKSTWRSLCLVHHPDHGGLNSNFLNLMTAWNHYRSA